jgi:transposase
MKKKDCRTLPPESQETLRGRVVDAILGGMKQKEAVRVFGVARSSINNWMAAYRAEGAKGLRRQKRGPKGGLALEPWQAAQTVRAITGRCPDQLKLPFALWTREAVVELMTRKFGVAVSVWTAGRYLKRWGLTPQKPLRRAFEQDPEAVRRWLTEEYPGIRRAAKREGAEIHWGDEMGLRSDHQTGTSYGRKGHTPVIPGTGQRFKLNMISTVTNRGSLRFMVFKKEFNAKVFIKFLRRLLRTVPGKIYLIVDRHTAHKAAETKRWLTAHADRIRMFFLPGYSPQLNPDEFLNNDVKSNALGRRRPASREEMAADVHGYLRSTQRQPAVVRSLFRAPSVRYAAA